MGNVGQLLSIYNMPAFDCDTHILLWTVSYRPARRGGGSLLQHEVSSKVMLKLSLRLSLGYANMSAPLLITL